MKKYITSVSNATTKALSVWGFVGAGVTSGLLSNFARYSAGMIIGALLCGLATVPPTTVTNVDPGHVVMTKYRAMVETYEKEIARDDFVLNHFMGNTWDRGCIYDRVPQIKLADGSMRFTLFQICEKVEK